MSDDLSLSEHNRATVASFKEGGRLDTANLQDEWGEAVDKALEITHNLDYNAGVC